MPDDNVKHAAPVPPFVSFVASAVPMVFDNSMSYYEALCGLWKYIQDNVIDVINNNASVTEGYIEFDKETREMMETLKTYVDNYFDNLDVQEEINNKLDAMVEDGTFQTFVDAYFPKKVDYYHITSESTSDDIIDAFAVENAKVIEFDSGTYELSDDLILTSNTTVYMNGASLTRSGSQWCLGYDRDSEYTGYGGIRNVKFHDGSIQIPIALMHNVGFEFNNMTFLPVNDHAIQMGGCKDIVINGCTFKGRIINDSIADHFEAVQLESCTRAGQPFLNDADSPSYDSKGNYNVTIKDCVFESGDGSTTKMYTAIGHHSSDDDNAYPNENVTIENCTFGNIWYAQICPAGFNHCVIRNNIFNITNNTGSVQNIRFRLLNKDIIIENNTFVGGVQSMTNVNISDYCIGLQIINNSFDSDWNTNLCNILLANWKNVVIRDNIFKKAKNYSIYVGQNSSYPADNIKIVGNHFAVDNLTSTGQNIYIRYCSNVEMYDNTFVKPAVAVSGKYSILATNDATNISFANNNTQGTEGTFMTGVTDYTNIYDVPELLYLEDDSQYQALTDVSPTKAFTQFERLVLIIHKSQDPTKMMSIPISSYSVGKKLYLGRSYSLQLTDGTNTGIATFTINNDGTFSYTSANSFTLRRIYAIN